MKFASTAVLFIVGVIVSTSSAFASEPVASYSNYSIGEWRQDIVRQVQSQGNDLSSLDEACEDSPCFDNYPIVAPHVIPADVAIKLLVGNGAADYSETLGDDITAETDVDMAIYRPEVNTALEILKKSSGAVATVWQASDGRVLMNVPVPDNYEDFTDEPLTPGFGWVFNLIRERPSSEFCPNPGNLLEGEYSSTPPSSCRCVSKTCCGNECGDNCTTCGSAKSDFFNEWISNEALFNDLVNPVAPVINPTVLLPAIP